MNKVSALDLSNYSRRSFIKRTGSLIKNALVRPESLVSLILSLVLVMLVLYPLTEVIKEAFTFQDYDQGLADEVQIGTWTIFHVKRIFFGEMSWALFYKPFGNSLIVAFSVTILALTTGGGLAWIVVRTNIPFRNFLNTLVVTPYMMPSWVLALAWISFFKNDRIAGAEGIFAYFFEVQPPDWIAYGLFPIIVTLSLHYYVYSYLLISGALTSVDTSLEEAGACIGLSRWRQFRVITAPLLLPALGSAIVMTFIRVIGTFGTPALLGLPVRFFTLPTQIYTSLTSRNLGDGFMLALVLVLLSALFIFINSRMIGVRKSFVTMSGKGFRRNEITLGNWKWPLFILIGFFLFAVVVLPIGLLFWESIILEPGIYSLDNLTSHYWFGDNSKTFIDGELGVFMNDHIIKSIWNSLKLAFITSVFCGLIGVLVGYAVVRTRGTFSSRSLEAMAFTPYIFPAVALSAIYLGMFARPIGFIPALYGTFVLIVLISVVKALPFTSRTGISAMLQIDKSLEEAARVIGLGWFKRMWRIILPMAASGMISGMLLTYITVMRELSLIILLVTPSTEVLTTLIYEYQSQDLSQHAGATTIVLVILIVSIHILIRLITRGSQIKGFS